MIAHRFASLLLLALTACAGAVPVDRVGGEELLRRSPGGHIRLGGYVFDFSEFHINEGADSLSPRSMELVARLGESENFLLLGVEDGKPTEEVRLLLRGELLPVTDLSFRSTGPESVRLEGRLSNGAEVTAHVHSSAGTSTIRVEGTTAFLQGQLGSGTYAQLEYLLEAHPEVQTLVLEDVPGSLNDDMNLLTGRMLRESGLHAVIPAGGVVASGGVALFVAAEERTIEPGARLGVHAWVIPGVELEPASLSREHPAHRRYLDYFREYLEHGVEFYFFTLAAAPFEGVHWLDDVEIERFGLRTE